MERWRIGKGGLVNLGTRHPRGSHLRRFVFALKLMVGEVEEEPPTEGALILGKMCGF